MEKIQGKKYLNTTKLSFIQYQFELLVLEGEEASIISAIRKLIKQEDFDRETFSTIDSFLRTVKNP